MFVAKTQDLVSKKYWIENDTTALFVDGVWNGTGASESWGVSWILEIGRVLAHGSSGGTADGENTADAKAETNDKQMMGRTINKNWKNKLLTSSRNQKKFDTIWKQRTLKHLRNIDNTK